MRRMPTRRSVQRIRAARSQNTLDRPIRSRKTTLLGSIWRKRRRLDGLALAVTEDAIGRRTVVLRVPLRHAAFPGRFLSFSSPFADLKRDTYVSFDVYFGEVKEAWSQEPPSNHDDGDSALPAADSEYVGVSERQSAALRAHRAPRETAMYENNNKTFHLFLKDPR